MEQSSNVLVEGDNLHALVTLYRESSSLLNSSRSSSSSTMSYSIRGKSSPHVLREAPLHQITGG